MSGGMILYFVAVILSTIFLIVEGLQAYYVERKARAARKSMYQTEEPSQQMIRNTGTHPSVPH